MSALGQKWTVQRERRCPLRAESGHVRRNETAKRGCKRPQKAHLVCMTDILDTPHMSQEEPKLIVRKASHAPVWSVWAVLDDTPSEEIFEGSSEEEASSWISTGGQAWLGERRRKRSS